MVRHVVMFKFLPEADGRSKAENVRMTAERLSALPALIPEILHSEVHIGAAARADANCDLLLISDFESFETLGTYLVHPDGSKHKLGKKDNVKSYFSIFRTIYPLIILFSYTMISIYVRGIS